MARPPGALEVVRYDEDPSVEAAAAATVTAAWPAFMLESPVARRLWGEMTERFPRCQCVLRDRETGEVVAQANAIPFRWDGTDAGLRDDGWDWVMDAGVDDHAAGRAPTALSAIQAVVAGERQGQGLSAVLLHEMHRMAGEIGVDHLVAPVRPTAKAREPLVPMEDYAARRRADGAPADPWLRAHWRLGARVVRVAPRSMTIPAPIEAWRRWTGLPLDADGAHVVPGALTPVEVDLAAGRGLYVEPNVWMHHPADGSPNRGRRPVRRSP